VNVFVLTEGWDCPAVDVVTIARKMGSCAMYMQACGRGLRLSPGKDHMTLLDLAGVSHIHGSPLDDRIFSLDGIGMKLAKQGPRFCRACGNLLDEDGPCSKCKRSSRGAVSDPKYSRDPLEKYAKYKTDDEATRAKRLAKFLGQARAKRYSIGWAAAKYRHVYSVTPPYKIMALAKLIERGERLT
jgi:superfamily II DNA or RNA helicase